MIRLSPSDLTTPAKRSGGAFPFSEVNQAIGSGPGQQAHGDAENADLGRLFRRRYASGQGRVSAADADHIVQGRILSLVYYLESIQK